MCETEIISCRVLNISPTITASLRKVHCNALFGVPEGIRQTAGQGLFESSFCYSIKSMQNKKSSTP